MPVPEPGTNQAVLTQLALEVAAVSAVAGAALLSQLAVEVAVPRGPALGCTQLVLEVATPYASDEPLLDDEGAGLLYPEWPVPLTHRRGVLESEGAQRHTRLTHEKVPRRYGLRVRLGNGADVLVLRRALEVSKGGATPLRWRHPKDDPAGPVESAPRWLILNAAEGQMALARSAGGAAGDFTLEVEEV